MRRLFVLSCFIFLLLFIFANCQNKQTKLAVNSGVLILKRDSITLMYAYFDKNGNKILGNYLAAYYDTIRDYGIVEDSGFVLIDKHGKHIYKIFPYDNGPDYTSEGLYRIIENGKIGYVDSATSILVIKPIFDCAWPFQNGKAKVSLNCNNIKEGEYWRWVSDDWFYIDKKGNRIKLK